MCRIVDTKEKRKTFADRYCEGIKDQTRLCGKEVQPGLLLYPDRERIRLQVQEECGTLSLIQKQMYLCCKHWRRMMNEKTRYFVLRKKAVPEVLLKVVEAKRLLESGKVTSVQDATDLVGISRSSFYKYKDDIFPFHDNAKGKTITMVIQLEDEPGLLSVVLQTVAEFHANILTIHQSIPVNGIASLTLSVDVLPETGDMEQLVEAIEAKPGIHYLKILARE